MRNVPRVFVRLALSLAAVTGVAAGAAACHAPPREPLPPGAATTLRVENQAYLDMNIYVVRGSQRIRLGTATGNSTSLFRIPADVVESAITLRFLADPIGGTRSPISDEIAVRPGDTVTLTIPPS